MVDVSEEDDHINFIKITNNNAQLSVKCSSTHHGATDYKEGVCSLSKHKNPENVTSEMTITQFFQNIGLDPNQYKKVKSLDLGYNIEITYSLIEQLVQSCPQIECLYINGTKFEQDGWIHMLDRIVPQLKHLCMDDRAPYPIKHSYDINLAIMQLFARCQGLDELKIIITRADFSPQCFTLLADTTELKFLHLNQRQVTRIKKPYKLDQGESPLRKILASISLNRTLEFLRLESKEPSILAVQSMRALTLPGLRALNIDAFNFYGSCEDCNIDGDHSIDTLGFYRAVMGISTLEALTFRLGNGCDQLLGMISQASFCNTLTSLKLMNGELNKEPFERLLQNLPQLSQLILYDCSIDVENGCHMRAIAASIANCRNLTDFRVELHEDLDIKEHTTFTYLDYKCLYDIMVKITSITYLSFINIPTYDKADQIEHKQKIVDLGKRRGIKCIVE